MRFILGKPISFTNWESGPDSILNPFCVEIGGSQHAALWKTAQCLEE